MIEITTQSGVYGFIEVSHNVNHKYRVWHDFSDFYGDKHNQSTYLVTDKGDKNHYYKLHKLASIEIISSTKDITEKQAESIVEHYVQMGFKRFVDYVKPYHYHDTAIKSIESLIKYNGLDVNKYYLIIKIG